MEQTVLFEEKVYLSPKDMNNIKQESLDSILHRLIKQKLEKKCNQHGFVVPNSIEVLSRSMGQLESGKFTGNIIFYIQAQGKVYNPANGTKVIGQILKKNKMGLYIIYKNAIRILVPRDLHIGKENIDFESLEPGNVIEVEIRKSRFQINDQFILSIATFVRKASESDLEEDFEDTSEPPEQNKKTFAEERAAEEQANESSEEDEDEGDEDEGEEDEEYSNEEANNAVNESKEEDSGDIDESNENLEFEIK